MFPAVSCSGLPELRGGVKLDGTVKIYFRALAIAACCLFTIYGFAYGCLAMEGEPSNAGTTMVETTQPDSPSTEEGGAADEGGGSNAGDQESADAPDQPSGEGGNASSGAGEEPGGDSMGGGEGTGDGDAGLDDNASSDAASSDPILDNSEPSDEVPSGDPGGGGGGSGDIANEEPPPDGVTNPDEESPGNGDIPVSGASIPELNKNVYAIRQYIEFFLFGIIPIAAAVLVVYVFCRWFGRTFCFWS